MVKEDQIKLMQTIIDQQEKRIQEKDAVIADLRKLVDELQSCHIKRLRSIPTDE